MAGSDGNFYFSNGLRRSGSYDSIFYTCYADIHTFDIRCRFDLKQRLNRARLQKAADDALRYYPEFKVRPVIYQGRIAYEENFKPVKIAEDDNEKRYFGSDGENGTNGYLFLFLVGERHITFSLFHSLTDARGMISYVITVLWKYAQYSFPFLKLVSPKFFEPYGVRLDLALFDSMDDLERYDAIKKFGVAGDAIDPIDKEKLYRMPEEVYDKEATENRLVNLEISNSAFLKKTLELHTTFAPLLAALAGEAIASRFDIGDKVISIITTADSRRFFKTKTLCNMAYNVPLPLYKEDLDMPLESICAKLKADMKKQLTKEQATAVMGNTSALGDQVDAMGEVDKVSDYLCGPEGLKTQNENGTLFLTYPGRVDNNIISKLLLNGVTPGMLSMERAINVYAHRDSLVIQLSMKSDDMTLVNSLRSTLIKHGFDPKVYDMGVVRQNILDYKRIKRVADPE